MLIAFELDIQALTETGIRFKNFKSFCEVKELNSRSMSKERTENKMQTLLISSFDRRVGGCDMFVNSNMSKNSVPIMKIK